jgi:hypothetical protein
VAGVPFGGVVLDDCCATGTVFGLHAASAHHKGMSM